MTDWLTYKGQYPWLCDPVVDKPEYNEGSSITKRPGISGGSPIWKVNQSGPAITPTHIPCGYWTNQYGKTLNRVWYIYGSRWYGPVAYVGTGQKYSTFVEAWNDIEDNCLYVLSSGSYDVDMYATFPKVSYVKCMNSNVFINLGPRTDMKLYIEGGTVEYIYSNVQGINEVLVVNRTVLLNNIFHSYGSYDASNTISNCTLTDITLHHITGGLRTFIINCIVNGIVTDLTDGTVLGEFSYIFPYYYNVIKTVYTDFAWSITIDLEDVRVVSRIDFIATACTYSMQIDYSLDGVTYVTGAYYFDGVTGYTAKVLISNLYMRYVRIRTKEPWQYSWAASIIIYEAYSAADLTGYGPSYGNDFITYRDEYK